MCKKTTGGGAGGQALRGAAGMYEILNFLDGQMETPAPYGVFHLCAFALVLLAAVLLCAFCRDVKDRSFRRICFLAWFILFCFETYKQINFSFNYNGGEPYWDYQWYAFPFQLCSSPLYVLPLVFLSREGSRIRRAAVSFMSFYSLFAGFAVMFYPATVFVSTIGINIQTMVWHGTQVILGIFFVSHYRRELSFKHFAAGIPVFLVLVGIALALDMIMPNHIGDETFNMFFISPKFPSTLPVLSIVWERCPWPVFLAVYAVGYTFAAWLVFILTRAITARSRRG